VLLAASQLGEGLMINKAKLALIVAVAAHRLRSLDRSTAIYVMNKYDILLVEIRI
jgi:hypothetical protein